MKITSLLGAALLGLVMAAPASAAKIVLNNVDPPGIGFNDPTPATPVGGNMGTTVGEQRLIAYRKALELWGKTLSSRVTIVVRGSFARLDCDRGVLAQAGALQIFSDFPNAPLAGHWYGVALANAIAGEDLAPGGPDVPGPADQFADDIVASFNGDVGKADCLPGPGWYYGLDNNATGGQIDFLDTFMHEVAHGLGFQNFASESSGGLIEGLPDVYMAHTRDLVTGKQWNTMTAPEIVASAIRNGKVVWTGRNVTANSRGILGPYEGIRVTGGFASELEYGTASFGALPSVANFNGQVVVGLDAADAAGPTITDGCSPFVNATAVTGKVALVDRGTCGFAVKAKNAQLAGATALIVANTLGRSAAGMGGTDPTVTIPSIMVSNADGDAIKAALPGVSTAYFVDPTRRAGAADGFVRLYAPTVVQPGSSISHFDTVAVPNLLMEPAINGDLRSARNLDLTPSLMKDIGWRMETLKIGRCDTGVPNALPNGDLLHVKIEACAAASDRKDDRRHGHKDDRFERCVSGVARDLKRSEMLPRFNPGDIMRCVDD
jgi:PA domain